MKRPRRRSRPRELLLVPAIGLLAVLTVSAPASAVLIDPSFGPHSDHYGVHELIDTPEFPTACKYGANHHLKTINIRRPIMYAFDRTSGKDTQTVGWRYAIEYGDFTAAGMGYVNLPDWHASPWMKLKASDKRNAATQPETYSFSSNPTVHSFYRVSIQMRWYYPNASSMDGRALHVVQFYRLKDPTYGNVSALAYCESDSSVPIAAGSGRSSPSGGIVDPTAGPHSGDTGVHRLIDSYEYRTTCKYDATHTLRAFKIRAPIVFGDDRTNHLDEQTVGWRYRIEFRDPVVAGETYSNWDDWYVSPVMKAKATDERNAAFKGETYTFTGDPTTHYAYRVSIDLLWYYPTASHKDGSAVHLHSWYVMKDPVFSDALAGGSCVTVSGGT